MKLDGYLDELENYFSQLSKKNESVSKVDIAWQIDHILNVIIQIIVAMEKSDPKEYQAGFNWRYEVLNFFYFIPRGKGRAPKQVMPEGEIDVSSLTENLKKSKEQITKLQTIEDAMYFPHPLFGHIKKKRAIRFLGMHTNHHLKIIRDIAKS